MNKTSIQTVSGVWVDLLRPTEEQIMLYDIAYSLSRQCRFTGHTDKFYSVAQHCVEVSNTVPTEYALEALMHDASEAYLGDVSSPLKAILGTAYTDLESAFTAAINDRFSISSTMDSRQAIKRADVICGMSEAHYLMPEGFSWLGVHAPEEFDFTKEHMLFVSPVGPDDATDMFLARFDQLIEEGEAKPHLWHSYAQ